MKPLLLSLLLTLSLVGCSSMMPQTTESMAKYIDTYGLTADQVLRESMRNEINALTKYCDIQVTCEGDE